LPVLFILPHGLHQLGQRRQERAIHQGEDALDVIEGSVGPHSRQSIEKFTDDPTEQIGVKDTCPSDNEPNEAREQPRIRCTFLSSLIW
ncbi:MAG: hypothetical protein V3W34_06875, partial [Phycisphaerae bacterium]